MSWRDLLASNAGDERVVYPWTGGRSLRLGVRVWRLEGDLPPEHGWWQISCASNRKARWKGEPGEPETGKLVKVVHGYLVGDRMVPDGTVVNPDPHEIAAQAEHVHLIEPGLDRFARISAGRIHDEAPLVYRSMEFPLGPEDDVLSAYLDGESIDGIKGVSPALDAAFRMECHQRAVAERRRQEAERRRREEDERRAAEEQRRQLLEQLGDGAGRRRLAAHDFAEAARAALAIGGAQYLDHRPAARRTEMAVRFRLESRRFECVCDARTLQVIDAGICLTAHYDDHEFKEGTKGDAFFTLESLPAVIRQAIAENKLVIFRHVD